MSVASVEILEGDCLGVLRTRFPDPEVDLVYMDPPFNTGRTQVRRDLSYQDTWESSEAWMTGFLRPRILESWRVLKETGSLFVHLDAREVHHVKVMMDRDLGRDKFLNEIIWAYDFGGRSKTRWSPKHDTILWYAKDPESYTFRYQDLPRVPYLSPGLVGPEKAARGKTPTDCWGLHQDVLEGDPGDLWWHTIVPTNGKEKTGYPTQKPLGVLKRVVGVHTNPGDLVLDPFAGSGTTGEAARVLGRRAVLVDQNPQAIQVMRKRFSTTP